MPAESDEALREILAMDTIAVVGCSGTPGKDAHEIPRYLQQQGYGILPVNPNRTTVLGEAAVDSLSDVSGPIEIVNVFRPSEEVDGIVWQSIERGDVDVIWLQLGIHDNDAVDRADAAGIRVVQDRCMMVEHERLMVSA